jgi:uncharacterized protein (DUF1684 family)
MQYPIVPLALIMLLAPFSNPAIESVVRTEDTRDVSKDERDSITAAIEKERKETEQWLKSSPSSYLATIQRVDFGDRITLTVGRAEDNDVRVDDPEVAPHHLAVTVTADSFLVEAKDPDALFLTSGRAVRSASVGPSAVKIGRFSIRLSHQRFPALIVFDPSSPRFAAYKGLRYFPVDLAYRFVLSLKANPRPDTVVILSTRGNRRNALRVGWFEFEVGTTACRLEVTRLLEPGVSEKSYSVFFRDLTCGTESYPVGRYVEAEQLEDGRFLLDFNSAYNPACAFSPHYNCPIPPKANDLQVRIPAGEMNAHYMDHED